VGPELIGWTKDRWGSYAGGLDVVGAMMALSAVLLLVLRGRMREAAIRERGLENRDYGTARL
jgi:ACS family tartrate transporter-like MFS transporter